jgi:hypothetical protein
VFLSVAIDKAQRRPLRFAELVHLAEVKLGQFEMGHGGFLGRGAAGTVELFERAVGVVPN